MVVSADGVKSIHLQQVNGFLKYNVFLQKPAPSIVTHTNKMCSTLHSKHVHIANKNNKFVHNKFPLNTDGSQQNKQPTKQKTCVKRKTPLTMHTHSRVRTHITQNTHKS